MGAQIGDNQITRRQREESLAKIHNKIEDGKHHISGRKRGGSARLTVPSCEEAAARQAGRDGACCRYAKRSKARVQSDTV